MDLIQFSSSPWCWTRSWSYLFFLLYLTTQINHTNSSILNSSFGEIDSKVDKWRNTMMAPDANGLASRCSLEMFSNNSDAFWACRYQRKFHARNCVFFFFSLELNMLCKGTGFRTQFRLKMRRRRNFRLCNISFFATLSSTCNQGLFSYQSWNGMDGFWQNGVVLESMANAMHYLNNTR